MKYFSRASMVQPNQSDYHEVYVENSTQKDLDKSHLLKIVDSETLFEQSFDNFYEKEFIDIVFDNYTNIIERAKFINAVHPSNSLSSQSLQKCLDFIQEAVQQLDEENAGRISWIFKPQELRFKYRNYFDSNYDGERESGDS